MHGRGARKNSPSAAMAYKGAEPAESPPRCSRKVDTTTVSATSVAPDGTDEGRRRGLPTRSVAASSAIGSA